MSEFLECPRCPETWLIADDPDSALSDAIDHMDDAHGVSSWERAAFLISKFNEKIDR